jgi:hypothetical protein
MSILTWRLQKKIGSLRTIFTLDGMYSSNEEKQVIEWFPFSYLNDQLQQENPNRILTIISIYSNLF